MNKNSLECFSKIQELDKNSESFVLATIITSKGSVPQETGAKAVFTKQGLVAGTVGGGKIEARATLEAQGLLEKRENSQFFTWNLNTDLGMTCGGEVRIFFETYLNDDWNIAIFGAGHVSQALVRLLLTLDCTVSCFDTRRDWIDKLPESKNLKKVYSEDLSSEVEKIPERSFFVVMTQGHKTDLPVLEKILRNKKQAPYVGAIGSKAKSIILRRDLEKVGLTRSETETFFCPMGLDLGNSKPEEIAVSIVSQLLQIRDSKPEL